MKVKGKELSPFIILEALWWSAIISIAVRILPLNKIFKVITPKNIINNKKYNRETILNSVTSVLVLQSKLFPAKCWKKSMLLFRLLKKYGYDVKLHFGVAVNTQEKRKSILYGHSWVSIENIPLFDSDRVITESMTRILTFPQS